jgi:hypothetical protein
MNKYDLSIEEASAFQAIKEALLKLPTASQYNVLRVTAHNMDRELVRPGATRAAAAVAGSTAQARCNAEGAKKVSTRPSAPKTGLSPGFVQSDEGKALVAAQTLAKQALGNPPTVEQLAALRQASLALREGHCSFLASQERA